MGNRAVVIFQNKSDYQSPGVYLHWNGGPESVYAFLDAMERYGCRMAEDPAYAAARFCQIACNFIGGTLSVGIQCIKRHLIQNACPGDNGIYIVTLEGVQRFKNDKWMTPEQVEAEKAEAYKHPYHTDKENINTAIDKANACLLKKK